MLNRKHSIYFEAPTYSAVDAIYDVALKAISCSICPPLDVACNYDLDDAALALTPHEGKVMPEKEADVKLATKIITDGGGTITTWKYAPK